MGAINTAFHLHALQQRLGRLIVRVLRDQLALYGQRENFLLGCGDGGLKVSFVAFDFVDDGEGGVDGGDDAVLLEEGREGEIGINYFFF